VSARQTFFFVVLASALLASGLFALTEQEKKELFLKAREEMRTIPASPRPTARPKPKPATPRPTARPTAKPTPSPEATPVATPLPSAEPTPEVTRESERERATEQEKERERERERATPRPTPKPTPTATPQPTAHPRRTPEPHPSAPITIRKSGLSEDEGFQPPPPRERRGFFGFGRPDVRYRYLTPSVRDAINHAPVKKRRWRYIVVHNSGSRQGNAKIFEYYHRRVRKMPNGMAYHFVIGNGTSSGNGLIEIGGRWTRQINGGHVHSDYLNNIALGICLVGDYNRHDPTPQQLESLAELIRYLQRRCGKVDGHLPIVKPHKAINPPRWPTDCPGDRFPYKWLSRFN
jgi:hypothetical protein